MRVFGEGEAAVLVFFVISGYVLTISARTGAAHRFGYLPTRAARLAIPAAASVALAFTIALVVPRVPHAARTARDDRRPRFFYIPVFVLGVLLARHQSHLHQIAQRLPRDVWALLSTATLLLLTAP